MIFSLRLRPGKDDDIRERLQKISPGERSRKTREALRAYLKPLNNPPKVLGPTEKNNPSDNAGK